MKWAGRHLVVGLRASRNALLIPLYPESDLSSAHPALSVLFLEMKLHSPPIKLGQTASQI
jgi:hypothetical protein